jgi:hypothetical protein
VRALKPARRPPLRRGIGRQFHDAERPRGNTPKILLESAWLAG